MSCAEIAEKLVENSRKQLEPGPAVRTHIRSCSACRNRWEEQETLTAHLKAIRFSDGQLRSSAASREMLMARFAQRKRVQVMPQWTWALAAAAVVVLTVSALPEVLRRSAAIPVAPSHSTVADDSSRWASDQAEVPSDASSDPESEGFMAVPFVPPLATGEMLRIVHTELNPAALASLGVSVDPAWTTQLPADLLLGEDGMPRAVRVSETTSVNGGF